MELAGGVVFEVELCSCVVLWGSVVLCACVELSARADVQHRKRGRSFRLRIVDRGRGLYLWKKMTFIKYMYNYIFIDIDINL